MPDADDAFSPAIDHLIALYRSIERRTLDLPLLSFMPFIISIWAFLKFIFFFYVGIFLIIPVNLVIWIRNFFPGHWRYKPFFLTHLYYAWLWIWRGEVPTGPSIFIRPLLNIFMKAHFETRLRRLRLELVLQDGLSDATRSTLLGRLDSELERWKSPRYGTIVYTVVVPAVISLPAWSSKLEELIGWLGIRPADVVAKFFSENISTGGLLFFGLTALGYIFAIPVTAFLAKRGLFIGADRICFPGGQEGSGAYLKEREILGSVGVRCREMPTDLWILAISFAVTGTMQFLTWEELNAWTRSMGADAPPHYINAFTTAFSWLFFFSLLIVAALRRRRTGRA